MRAASLDTAIDRLTTIDRHRGFFSVESKSSIIVFQ